MNWYNRTLSDWHQTIINGLSKNYNDLLCAPEAIYLILFDWCVYILGCLKDCYNWFGRRWQHDEVDVYIALIFVTGIFCLPALFMLAQCFFFTGKWAPNDRFRKHISQRKILHLHELAKTAYKEGHAEMVLEYADEFSLNINYPAPHTGLTLFLCACLSGNRRLVCELLKRGGDVNVVTSDKDSALYLATFGVINSLRPDLRLLQDLLNVGCSINCQNAKGFTPLHRAATRGNVPVINWLLQHGADRYLANNFGVYPVDSATNAGHREVTMLLSIENSGRVCDIVQPQTPVRVKLGSSPQQQRITESLKQLRSVKKKILKLMTP